MRILDLRCQDCDDVERRVHVTTRSLPPCPCGGERCVTWDRPDSMPALDSYSTPRYDDGLGTFVSSTREREQIAKRHGLTPCGDKVGGARPDHTLSGRITIDPKAA